MLVIAIDGACRRNGKPDCVSAGGVFVQQFNEEGSVVDTHVRSTYELNSTNQRGEMLALIDALDYAYSKCTDAQIITDSEYLFNTMTKDWITNWCNKGWITATGEPVKNKDLWEKVYYAQRRCSDAGLEVMFYHIKGHVIPFGKVTANTLLSKDETGRKLLEEVYTKFFTLINKKKDEIEKANKLSIKNNGFALPKEELCKFIVANVVVDAVATKCVEAADALYHR